jgi:hypothetical protein
MWTPASDQNLAASLDNVSMTPPVLAVEQVAEFHEETRQP